MTKYAKWFAVVATVGAAACLTMWISMPTPKNFPVYTRIDLEPPVYVDDASSGVDVHAREVDVNSGRFDDSRKVDENPVDSRKVDVNGNVDYVQVGVDSGKVDIYPKSVEKVAGKDDNLPEKIGKDTSEDESVLCSHKTLRTPDAFFKFLSNTSSECESLTQFPPGYHPHHNLRGNWVCTTPKYLSRGDCLIYFFTDGLDTSFGLRVHEQMSCKVFIFEPHDKDDQSSRSAAVKIYHKTIKTHQNAKGKIKMVYNQLMNLMKTLSHHESQIDLLKIDTTQGEELIILGNIFFAPRPLYMDIKQISYVMHLRAGLTSELQQHWLYFELLQCHDFRLIRTDVAEYEDGSKPGSSVRVYELLWVRKQ